MNLFSPSSSIPRSTERGSIEAQSRQGSRTPRLPFRVQPNAAPLKPGMVDVVGCDEFSIPRSTERGSIEASKLRSHLIRPPKTFRVQPNAAPLKRVHRLPHPAPAGSFRVQPNAAPLKLLRVDRCSSEIRSFRVQPNAAPLKRRSDNIVLSSIIHHSAFNRTRLH